MTQKINGTLKNKFQITEHGESFKKLEFIVESNDKYPQLIKMEVHNDNIHKILDLPDGTNGDFYYNIRGRKWYSEKNNKTLYFNSIVFWKVEIIKTDLNTDVPLKVVDSDDPLPF